MTAPTTSAGARAMAAPPLDARSMAIAEALAPDSLSLILLPTEKCNLRCTYCYETFEIGRMSAETIQSVKNLIDQRLPKLGYLSLAWFGGEPLVAADIILDIAGYAMERCREQGVEYYGDEITTNAALLTRPLLDKLALVRQTKFQISLDGWREGHDRTRRNGSGGGTFDIVWNALLMLRDSPYPELDVTLRIHLTPDNLESIRELAAEIKREFGSDGRFGIYLKVIENLGGPQSGGIVALDRAERAPIIREMAALLAGMRGVPDPAAPSGPPTKVCYASKPNNLIVRANGRIAKCTVAFEDPKNDIGALRTDGTLQIDNGKLAHWFRGLQSRDPDILACPVWIRPHEAESARRVIPIASQPA